MPFAIFSDDTFAFATALRLPTFDIADLTLLNRMVQEIDDGVITKVLFPVFPPRPEYADVVAWLQAFK